MRTLFYNYKRFIFLIITIICYCNVFAQSVVQRDALSPDMGALLRIKDISMNLFTGRPEISIPLYSIELKNYSYDIQLFYNAEGNKPDMPVGNTGLGWSITQGQICRISNGYPDEIYTLSEYFDRTNRNDWCQESNLYQYYNPSGSNENLFHEPDLDEFVINIGKLYASFYIYRDETGKIKTKIASQNSPYFEVKDVEIGTFPEIPFAEGEIYNPYLNKTFRPKVSIRPRPVLLKEITIVDSDGVTYVFGGDINSVDLSCQYFQDGEYEKYFDKYGRRIPRGYTEKGEPIYDNVSWENFHSSLFATPATWHIKEISLQNGEYIRFDYSKSNISVREKLNLYKTSTVDFSLHPRFSSTITPEMLPIDVNPQYDLIRNRSYDIVYPSLLTKIHASNGDLVEFISSKRNDLPTYDMYVQQEYFLKDNYGGAITDIRDKAYSYKLDEVKSKYESVRFYYTDEPSRRLQLDSLDINHGEVYKFYYNPLLLPSYSEAKTDNWGYYNGKRYYPESGSDFTNLYAYRQPDSTYVKAEILEKIVYPTGGEVNFEYELHEYSSIATQYPFEISRRNGFTGGVRTKKIIYSDNNHSSSKQIKEYLYQNRDGSSSGILSVVPKYVASGRGSFHYELGNQIVNGEYYYDIQSDIQMNWTDQFHIGYSRVTEILSDGSKTIYSFVNHDSVLDEPSAGDLAFGMTDNLQRKFNSRKLSRGLLQSVEYFNATDKLLKKVNCEYHSDLSDYVKSINHFSFMGLQPIRVSANKIYTYFPFLKKKETILYTGCDSIRDIEEYDYNIYRLLARTRKYTDARNDNSMIETHTQYLSDLMEDYDYTVSSAIPTYSPLKVYDTMKTKGMLNYPIETIIRRDGKVISAEISTYKMSDKFVVPDKEYKLETNIPLEDYSPFRLTTSNEYSIDSRCVVEKEYLDFDSYCNPVNIVDRTNVNTAYLWGYKGQYPIAKVVNARNTFKSVPRYRDVMEFEYISLSNRTLTDLPQTHKFYSSRSGNVILNLEGELGFNWFLQVKVDNQIVYLVQNRSYPAAGAPWDTYSRVYKCRAEIYLPAGSHELKIQSAQAYNSTSSSKYSGHMSISYWIKESIEPETSGSDDFFYENFETNYGGSISGYHSKNSFIGEYILNVETNPKKEYFLDYQVFKNGKWNCIKQDFINGNTVIDEGLNPIDNIRVYPKDASITTYDYYPLIGLRCETDERGQSRSYQYDNSRKLIAVRDNDMNLVSKYSYCYQNQKLEPEKVYYNHERREYFTRRTCDASLGELGLPIAYVVPANKYTSYLSQEDANLKAYKDLLENGQRYADENGECSENIVLSVYNPKETPHVLEFSSGIQGSIIYDHYSVPPSEKIANTGDILKDYKPIIIYLPRKNYRNVVVYEEGNYSSFVDISLKSSEYNFELLYTKEFYPDYQDTYVIGNYNFPR